MTFTLILLLVIALFLVIFTLQNTQLIDVNFLFWTLDQVPLALNIFCCVLVGIIIGMGIYLPKVWGKQSQIKSLQRELYQLKKKEQQASTLIAPTCEEEIETNKDSNN
ncbi:MAG: lipopolysaccharide assembly LapA domain-containing protein [Mangrovibacterium sp.]